MLKSKIFNNTTNDVEKRPTFLDEVMNDIKDLTNPYSRNSLNARNSTKFAKLNPKSNFAQLTKKLYNAKWLGLSDEKKLLPLWEKYNDEVRYQSQRVLNLMFEKMGGVHEKYGRYIKTENDILLSIEGVNPVEFVRQYYNIFYCETLLPNKEVIFRNCCGPLWLSYLDNIDYEGNYLTLGSDISKNTTGIVLDIGASYGLFSLLALKLSEGNCKTVLSEPNSKARQICLINRALNGYDDEEHMKVYNFAFGNKKGKKVLYTRANEQCSGKLLDLPTDAGPICPTHESEICNVITIDDYYRKLDERQRVIAQESNGFYVPPQIDFIKIGTPDPDKIIAGGSYMFAYTHENGLPDMSINITGSTDMHKKVKELTECFSASYNYKLRISKLHCIYNRT